MDTKSRFVFIWLDENQARINEVRAGWNLLNCNGDVWLKRMYLIQELSEADLQGWCNTVLTDHGREVLEDIGGAENNEVKISYNRDTGQYEIEVVERIVAVFTQPGLVIRADNTPAYND
jgi:hypothetical protein